jgi:hypothetical protein
MQDIISRHVINPAIIINDRDQTVDYNQLCTLIDRWKIFLVEKYHAQPGKKILIEFVIPNSTYYAAQFAAFELGLVVVSEWPYAYEEEDVSSWRHVMHGRIDYAIVSHGQTIPSDPLFNYWNYRRTTANSDFVITDKDFEEFETPHPERADIIAESVLATPDMIATVGASGGTTGVAKPTANSHKKLYRSSLRHVRLYKFDPLQDHCLHIQNTKFGAGLWYWFLPTMMACKQHSIIVSKDVNELAQVVHEKKINKVQIHTLPLILDFIDKTQPLEHNLEILSLFLLPKDYVEKVQLKKISAVNLVFGDTTIGGTFFFKQIDGTTLASSYEKNCLGENPDDFIEFETREGLLWMRIPSLEQDWMTSGDRFEIRDKKYYFYGRGNKYVIGGETVTLGDLDAEVERLFGTGAMIVVDDKEQKIYLAIFKSNPEAEIELQRYFESNFEKVCINQVARDLDPNRFVAARKIDREKLRDYFRYYHLKPYTS